MPSPLHGLNIIEPYPTSQSSDQLPPDFAAQLDLWSTLNFTSIDDFPSSAGTGTNPAPFSLGSSANTLDDLVRMGEEELLAGPSYNNGTIDPFQVAPFRQPAAKKQRTSTTTSAASKTRKTQTESPKPEDEDVDDDDEDGVDAQHKSATPLTAAEDKRRRNTAASARFRAKKKEREAALESKAKQLEGRVGELERECEALRRENGWLKGLVVGVTQAGGDLSSVPGLPASLAAPLPSVVPAAATGSKRKRE